MRIAPVISQSTMKVQDRRPIVIRILTYGIDDASPLPLHINQLVALL